MNFLLLGKVIVEVLLVSEVWDVLLTPGSRSAPISLALYAVETAGLLGLRVRIDEHAVASTALGMAETPGRVVAMVTISGATVGNLVPAVMGARISGIPLLLLIADHPAHLVGTDVNQTCDQLGTLGPAAVGVLRLASSTGTKSAWRATITRACALTAGTKTRRLGPVQVNVEPETPLVGAATSAFESQQVRPVMAPGARTEVCEVMGMARTVVLAGDVSPTVGVEVRVTTEVTGVPLLVEPSSNARTNGAVPRCRGLLPVLGPEVGRMVVFEHPTLSRPAIGLLGRGDIELVIVTPHADQTGPGHAAAQAVDRVLLPPGDPAWLAR